MFYLTIQQSWRIWTLNCFFILHRIYLVTLCVYMKACVQSSPFKHLLRLSSFLPFNAVGRHFILVYSKHTLTLRMHHLGFCYWINFFKESMTEAIIQNALVFLYYTGLLYFTTYCMWIFYWMPQANNVLGTTSNSSALNIKLIAMARVCACEKPVT